MKKDTLTYKDSGVDIDEGNRLVEMIKPAVKSTSRAGVMGAIGGFGGLFDLASLGYKEPVLVSGTDGVGTKLLLAQKSNIYDTIGIDLVAMCVNDILVQGAEPLFFLDYFACGKLNSDVATKVVKGIAEGCKMSGAALIGGETAEMPDMYSQEDYDLAGFCVGVAEKQQLLPQQINEGDIVLGLASSGVHSNGYSLIRKILSNNNIDITQDSKLAEMLLAPTKIYVKSLLPIIKKGKVKALAHITGGGITENIPRILSDNINAKINKDSWQKPKIYNWIQEHANIEEQEMLKTFNYGIGMAIIVNENDASFIKTDLEKSGEKVFEIGNIVKGTGVVEY